MKYHVFYLCLGSSDLGRFCSRSCFSLFFYRVFFCSIRFVLSFDLTHSLLFTPDLSYSLLFASVSIPSRPLFLFFIFLFLVCIRLHFVWVLFYSKKIKKKFIRITHSQRFHGMLMIFHGHEKAKSVWFRCVNSKLSNFFLSVYLQWRRWNCILNKYFVFNKKCDNLIKSGDDKKERIPCIEIGISLNFTWLSFHHSNNFFLPSTNLSTLDSIGISLQHTCDIKQFIAEVNVQFQVSKNNTVAIIKTSLATSAQFGQFYAKWTLSLVTAFWHVF